MAGKERHSTGLRILRVATNQRGLTFLEVLLSTVVLGIALTGFLMALSTASITSRMAIEENQLVYLASKEFEALRAANFEDVPFLLTSDVRITEEVPNYFRDIAVVSDPYREDLHVKASGDLPTDTMFYFRNLAFDGKRANFNLRWMGEENALAYEDTGGGPEAGGPGGGGPGAGGPGGDPGAGGGFAPDEYQWVLYAFPETTRISRILYDNRFNITEDMSAPPGGFDLFPHVDDVWQRNFEFFYSDTVQSEGLFDPWKHDVQAIEFVKDQGYGSTGVWVIFDDAETPMEAGIIGVHNIDTYSDFDADFHWPYVSEIEVYGFSEATAYIDEYRPEDEPGGIQYDNVIMYFPNYLGSGFDLGRRVYVEGSSMQAVREIDVHDGVDAELPQSDLIKVIIEFYPSSHANRDETWQKVTWWKDDTNEIARFQTSFYRDEPTRVDRLPNLNDLPVHIVYGDDEDLRFPFTVPGASEIRAHFGTFDLEAGDGITVEDKDGNTYPYTEWTAWVLGDTIVIHFTSDGSGNTFDEGWGGFEIDEVEVRWVGLESSQP